MSEDDLNSGQPITDPDLNAQPVTEQNLTDQVVQDQLADGTDANKTVKYSAMKKEVDARIAAEEKAAYAQRQLDLMAQNQQAMQQSQQQAVQQPMSNLERAMADCNVSQDELYGEAQVRVINRKDEYDRAEMQQQSVITTNLQFIANHPDVGQVAGSVNPATGQVMTMSPELAGILARKPFLRGACISTQAIYDIVMAERKLAEFEQKQTVLEQQQTRQGVDVATQPLGGSAAGGGGAGDQVQGQRMMTRAQVDEIEEKIRSGEIS